jgi:hypothetical protein
LVRSGGLIYNEKEDHWFNPFSRTDKGSKIVVYSSGSFGQHILSTNLKTNYFKIIKWIDVDYHDLKIGENTVNPISSIYNNEFDYLVIATINPSTHKSLKEELELMGIDQTKIVKINNDEKTIHKLLNDLGFDDDFIFNS